MAKFSKAINRTKAFIRRAKVFFNREIWNIDLSDFGKAKAMLLKDVKILLLTLDTFAERAIGFQSVALSYFCAMAFVPFIAVAFAITGGFGLGDKLKDMLLSLDVGKELIGTLLDASDKIIASATNGLFGLISALMFIWLVIWMMMRVEKVFNNVWGVRNPDRPFFKSLGVDIAILILSPFIILLLYSGTIVYSHILDLFPKWMGVSDAISSFLGWVIAAAVTVMIFSAMYKFIPAAKVGYKYALKAAVLAGIAFTILQYLYLETQVMVMRLNAVYGTIAAIPLFMMWLRYGWLIILLGAQVSYSFQTVNGLESESEIEEAIKNHKQVEEL
ncbi:MAG: YihY/virulence factor BrkB family protein [Candidatus Cryptobacteroides sp.]